MVSNIIIQNSLLSFVQWVVWLQMQLYGTKRPFLVVGFVWSNLFLEEHQLSVDVGFERFYCVLAASFSLLLYVPNHCPSRPVPPPASARTCANVGSPSSLTCAAQSGSSSSLCWRPCRSISLLRSAWRSSSNPTTSGRSRRPTSAAPSSPLRSVHPDWVIAWSTRPADVFWKVVDRINFIKLKQFYI